jgi:CRP/FNR family transcriptional regulator, anaerobic regulatory protein
VAPSTSLESVEPFHRLTDAGKAALRRGVRYAVFPNRTTVVSRADRVAGAYVVVSGRLRVYTISPAGQEATLYTIAPGETCVLALNCLFSDVVYPAWVEASGETRVAIVDGPAYRFLFENEPAVREVTVRAIATMAFRLMAALEDVHTRPLDQRLANFLVLHTSSDGEVRMTQQDIADHLGTTREVVARLLGRFARLRLVTRERGRVLVRAPKRLAQWADAVRPVERA